MSPAHTLDWWRARLEQDPDRDEGYYLCPVCGHGNVSMAAGDKQPVVVKAWSCEHEYADMAAALGEAEPGIPLKSTAPPVQRPDRPAYSPAGEHIADQVWRRNGWRWEPRGVKPARLHGGLATVVGVPDPIVLTEGHGPAIALNDAGIPAVATVTGKASTPDEVGLAYLYGRTVILSPDKGGEAHMERTGAVLSQVAAAVLVAPGWPADFPDNGDAADYLKAHGVKAMRDYYAAATPWSPAGLLAQPVSALDRIDPEPLVDAFAHPTAHTGLWGPNGAGKGVLAAWKMAARTRAGERVLLLDYEGHAAEWRSRLEDLGADLDLVYIALPLGLDGGQLKGAIWDQQEQIRAAADQLDVDWVYVDSVTAACGIADITATTAPGPYFAALNHIGRPSVSIGHVTKQEDLKYPFGSMAWRAFIRMGWSFAGGGDTRELVNRKTNDYPAQDSVTLDWAWTATLPPQKVPSTLTVTGVATPSIADRAWDALGAEVLTTGEVLGRVNADGQGPLKLRQVSRALSESPRFQQVPGQRGYWQRNTVVIPLKSTKGGQP